MKKNSEIENLLLKPFWKYTDIMNYAGVSKGKAYEIMKTCKNKYNGTITYEPKYVTCESVLNYFGTTREKEISLLDRKEVTNN